MSREEEASAMAAAEGQAEDLIDIKIRTLNEEVFPFRVRKDLLVLSLKVLIKEHTEVPAERQRLIYRGKVLQDTDLLSDHNVQTGHAMHMVVRPRPSEVNEGGASAAPQAQQAASPQAMGPRAGGGRGRAGAGADASAAGGMMGPMAAAGMMMPALALMPQAGGRPMRLSPGTTQQQQRQQEGEDAGGGGGGLEHLRQGLLTLHTMMSGLSGMPGEEAGLERGNQGRTGEGGGVAASEGEESSINVVSAAESQSEMGGGCRGEVAAAEPGADVEGRPREAREASLGVARPSQPDLTVEVGGGQEAQQEADEDEGGDEDEDEDDEDEQGGGEDDDDEEEEEQEEQDEEEEERDEEDSALLSLVSEGGDERASSAAMVNLSRRRFAGRRFFVGQWLDVKDSVNQWLEATIIEIRTFNGDSEMLVHYNGWPDRWDEWLSWDSPRISPFRTRTLHSPSPLHVSPYPQSLEQGAPVTGVDDVRVLLPDVENMLGQIQPLVRSLADMYVPDLEEVGEEDEEEDDIGESEGGAAGAARVTAAAGTTSGGANTRGNGRGVRAKNLPWPHRCYRPNSSRGRRDNRSEMPTAWPTEEEREGEEEPLRSGTGGVDAGSSRSGSSSNRLALARDVAPLLDRLGRMLTDLAPHLVHLSETEEDGIGGRDQVAIATAGEGEVEGEAAARTSPAASSRARVGRGSRTPDVGGDRTGNRRPRVVHWETRGWRDGSRGVSGSDASVRNQRTTRVVGPNAHLVPRRPERSLSPDHVFRQLITSAPTQASNIDIHIHAIVPLRDTARGVERPQTAAGSTEAATATAPVVAQRPASTPAPVRPAAGGDGALSAAASPVAVRGSSAAAMASTRSEAHAHALPAAAGEAPTAGAESVTTASGSSSSSSASDSTQSRGVTSASPLSPLMQLLRRAFRGADEGNSSTTTAASSSSSSSSSNVSRE